MNSIVSSNQRGSPGWAALVVLALFTPAALTANLVAHWKLNESNAPFTDASSNAITLQ